MKAVLVALLALHGAIHLMGFAKAFGLANLAALRLPISRPVGMLWLVAALAFVVSAGTVHAGWRYWAAVAAPAIVLSQVLVVLAWSDAKVGTVANLLLLAPTVLGLLDLRGSSFRSRFERDAAAAQERVRPARIVTEADLAGLPPQVQRYVRRTNAVGRERVSAVHVRFRGTMRPSPEADWMTIRAEQLDTFAVPERLFLMDARRSGVPFQALHVYRGETATMQVRVASMFDVVDARGAKLDQSETVTFFNDICLLAPAALVDADVEWRDLDPHHVLATFRNGGQTIRATLTFDAEGDLVDFVSNDRYMSADGKTYEQHPWSTPVHEYRELGGARLPSRVEALWKRPGGDFVYARFVVEDVRYQLGGGPDAARKFAADARAPTLP